MINFKKILIILFSLVYLIGCSPTIQEVKIKDLNAHSITFERAKPVIPNRNEAIENYKEYIKTRAQVRITEQH